MKFFAIAAVFVFATSAYADHAFTLHNKCTKAVKPVIADTRCGYSPRCDDAASFKGAQPGTLAAGASKAVTIPSKWVGRIFNQNGSCGPKGEKCTITEFNLDSGNQFTPQSYDISNIQGFTQSIQIGAQGCDTVTCTNKNCGCKNAYPVGDTTGCASTGTVDNPVRACGAGNIAFSVVFCP